ncbi:Kinesin motor domain protein [Raphanus sativus]|nr:Kinesin motor domain protein [Raphanus sativus]
MRRLPLFNLCVSFSVEVSEVSPSRVLLLKSSRTSLDAAASLTPPLRLRRLCAASPPLRAGPYISSSASSSYWLVLVVDIKPNLLSGESERFLLNDITRITRFKNVYKSIYSVIFRVVHGLNATVFAYGSTGSGKTYTMVGTRSDPGLMVLSLNTVFDMMKSDKSSDDFEVTCSYLEVYNEVIYDLLEKSSGHLELTSSERIQSRE